MSEKIQEQSRADSRENDACRDNPSASGATHMPPTIAAVATPPGTGGIGIIRLSGPEAFAILDRLFIPGRAINREAARAAAAGASPRRLTYGHIYGPAAGEDADEVMTVKMPRPRSYTKEDVAEIHCHGGPLVLRRILGLVLESGARPAEPGEFTKRAFLNGRVDLSQAEAVMGIIGAESERAERAALSQLNGGLAKTLGPVLDALLGLLARIELSIDYPEHGEDEMNRAEVIEKVTRICALIGGLEDSAENGRVYAQGLRTVIAGRPNVGKSSLLNALVKSERAIVTDIPGTTRDALTERVLLRDIPLLLTDTAGIREARDFIERLGVEKSLERAAEADLILWVIDGSEGLLEEDIAALRAAAGIAGAGSAAYGPSAANAAAADTDGSGARRVICVINKTDLPQRAEEHFIRQALNNAGLGGAVGSFCGVCAKNGAGIDGLGGGIESLFLRGDVGSGGELITNERHRQAVRRARERLDAALDAARQGLPEDLLAIDLSEAYRLLGGILGKDVGEDVVDRIFSEFCVGK
ncbi:MAG: tRNA uridine-5-carboxymethylaminomethyl(34) synthesis GTPase MnmE [Firmicutes bacterium]|nr:tRNA uridine-5-carboxymethylaminomethyl(34) synthesis GTPase MnmE [Bacillota bacterium]